MNQDTLSPTSFTQLTPKEAASRLIATRLEETSNAYGGRQPPSREDWLDEFAAHLDALRAAQSLRRTLSIWGLSQSEAARQFGVSRQALHKWLENGAPTERAESMADLAAATDLLVHYLKRERVPAVVRRPIPARANQSLLDLVGRNKTKAVLNACREMFDFHAVQS